MIRTHIFKNSRLVIIGTFFSRPIDNLPSIAHKPRNCNTTMRVYSVYPTTAIGQEHLVQDWLLNAEDDAIAAFEAEGCSCVFNRFGCVFHLEDTSVR